MIELCQYNIEDGETFTHKMYIKIYKCELERLVKFKINLK